MSGPVIRSTLELDGVELFRTVLQHHGAIGDDVSASSISLLIEGLSSARIDDVGSVRFTFSWVPCPPARESVKLDESDTEKNV